MEETHIKTLFTPKQADQVWTRLVSSLNDFWILVYTKKGEGFYHEEDIIAMWTNLGHVWYKCIEPEDRNEMKCYKFSGENAITLKVFSELLS